MMMNLLQLLQLIHLLLFHLIISTHASHLIKSPSQLLVISLDGFRYDYYDVVPMRSLQSITSHGVHARNGMKGVFSTVTFSSHWSLATGLLVESHGIIANSFYDPVTNTTFDKRSNQRYFFNGEPIWVTAKRQGKRVGIYFWIGSNVDFGKDVTPDYFYKKYDQKVPLAQRVDTVIKWLEDGVDLAMMYWHQPDSAGHRYGVFSDETRQELNEVDQEFTRMLAIMKDKSLDQKVNIMIVADHGMMNLTNSHNPVIIIQSDHPVLRQNVNQITGKGIVIHFWTKIGGECENATLGHLIKLSQVSGNHFTAWRKNDVPTKWGYKNSDRVAPVVAIAEPGYYIHVQKVSRCTHRF